MLLLRVVGILTAIAIGVGILTWLITGERKYLSFAGRIAKWALIAALAIFALLVAERLLVML
ncbi:MAG: hypothetical protein N3C63_10455 [Rhodocyclaceae bacterium]|nr:hypothetical protein [Rhodocyclaceae bacterium]